jgi:hypothetical protein
MNHRMTETRTLHTHVATGWNAAALLELRGFARFLAVLIALIPLVSLGNAGARASATEPVMLVRSFYVVDFDEETIPLSRRLKALRERAEAVSLQFKRPMAGLMHEWILGPQDPDNPAADGWQKSARVIERARSTRNATVIVTFRMRSDKRNRDEVRFSMLKENDRWVVDDIHYRSGGETLSELLRAGARGERN